MSNIRIQALSPTLGALLTGVNLGQALGDADRRTIHDALLKHQLLLFENQPLTPRQQRDFATRFGDLHVHPVYPNVPDQPEIMVLDTHADNLPDNDNWHTDVTFIETLPLGAVLSARELPPVGGDTLWSSSTAAYDALSELLKALLAGLTAEHEFTRSFPEHRFKGTPHYERWRRARDDLPAVVHPVVRTHPVTGRKGLFVNEGFTSRIRELSQRESDALLAFLFAHAARPEFTLRWRWKQHDLAFWDNRTTQHYAVADYLPARRIMHRATILGDRPF
ncbi:taurine dioxygenase [Crenobacter cavernae]|uniref:Taurine dioxygenase n=1 Tax=Crenobacter cavernae TaxID=2290923 RepID=A0A345Y256_9NEIS|nr:taurine dioxygenase [Crenobacter cavernae]AXK38008.1 taurine dioxygenase [Crenobacter cavernae]